MMPEIERFAKGLSKAAKRGLIEAWRTPAGRMAVGERCEGIALRQLEDAGLVDAALCLPPLGLAVRRYLQEQPQ